MRTKLLTGLAAVAGVLLLNGTAAAQNYTSKPIDTNALIVQPTDTATNIFSGTVKYVSRAVGSTIESNGFVKTINNLLGRTPSPQQTTQVGSNLPLPNLYQSTRYPSVIKPATPTTQIFGQSVGTTGR